MGLDKLANTFTEILKTPPNDTKPYDTGAEVTRIDDDGKTAWVHIPGGIDETPVEMTLTAKRGDSVKIRVSGGRAWIVGNGSAPPTDNTVANKAYIRANTALDNAEAARNAAEVAEADAERAHAAADSAEQDAAAAHTAADEAMGSAIAANIASNSALTQLSVVEDVASVLTWISEHGTYKLTDDTAVVSGKLYFSRSGDDYSLITAPTGNPHTNGYYEIDTLGDEAVSNYISSHLSLTNAGLWVVKDNSGYKILLANDGMRVYDNLGNLVVTYGTSIEFANNREFHIGNQNAYIIFNPSNNGSITIGGSNIILGTDKTLSEVLAEINNTFIFDVTYTVSGTDPNRIAHFEAHLYQGGVDVKSQYDPDQFTWYLKTEDGEDPIIPTGSVDNTGYTIDVNLSDCGYGAEVIAHFTTNEDSPLLTGDDDNLTDIDNTPLTGRTSSGESVRVRDLTVSTTLQSTDKLLIVGSEDEHLVTMQTLQTYLNTHLTKQILFNTTAAWNAQVQLQSQAGTLYVYTDHIVDGNNVIAGLKVGDGNAYLIDLPFTDKVIMDHIADTSIHITSSERLFWNNKVRCYMNDGSETVIFTTT